MTTVIGDERGRQRVVIEGVRPEIDGGRFPIKRTVGETVVVEADVFTDGHDALSALLRYRPESIEQWTELQMEFLGNDRWCAEFPVTRVGRYRYVVTGWVDHFATWRRDFVKKIDAGQDVHVDLLIGAQLIEGASRRAKKDEGRMLTTQVTALRSTSTPESDRIRMALGSELATMMATYPDRTHASTYDRELIVVVDREKARFSTWYEVFPRSCSPKAGQHGTFKDCEARLPYIAGMGFDVLYLPPIHPIGTTHRKGKNNAQISEPTDHGSPWAIGSLDGGHKAIHPGLGTLQDFRRLLEQARTHDIEIAMDIAFQCSPDHPYVQDHREWFRIRPDGTVQYAENPPKKYQDIFPLEFETDQWKALWEELKSVIDYWIEQGIRIFRVDNPHT
ncbi:MAG: maltotransferase domain-containing protein, partial [Nitrospiraceae bacterium]